MPEGARKTKLRAKALSEHKAEGQPKKLTARDLRSSVRMNAYRNRVGMEPDQDYTKYKNWWRSQGFWVD